jgi:hypothetical protein
MFLKMTLNGFCTESDNKQTAASKIHSSQTIQ